MARYSVATTRNNLSRLIDKARAGEEVVITRHGNAQARLSAVPDEPRKPKLSLEEMRKSLDEIETFRATLPRTKLSYLEMKRIEQDEWEARFDR